MERSCSIPPVLYLDLACDSKSKDSYELPGVPSVNVLGSQHLADESSLVIEEMPGSRCQKDLKGWVPGLTSITLCCHIPRITSWWQQKCDVRPPSFQTFWLLLSYCGSLTIYLLPSASEISMEGNLVYEADVRRRIDGTAVNESKKMC